MSDSNDPLNLGIDLNEVDTSRPVLKAGVYSMKVNRVEVSENSAGTGRNLVVDFALTAPGESVKGEQINPGFSVRNYYPLQPSEKNPDSDFWKQNLARLQDAVLGTSQGNRPPLNPGELREKQILVNIDIEESEEYGKQNRIKKLMRLEEE